MSWQMAIFTLGARLTVKSRLKTAKNVQAARASFERSAAWFKAPKHLVQINSDLVYGDDTVPALWLSSGRVTNDAILYYIHGGGFIMGSPHTHKGLAGHLARFLGVEAVLPNYRKAPEHPFPAGLEDVIAGYHALLARGYAGRIIIAGDSAGGGLALGLSSYICDQDLPQPLCIVALAPSVDQSFSGETITSNAESDAVLVGTRTEFLKNLYMGDQDTQSDYASPLVENFSGAPPVLIQASEGEILLDDALRMQNHLLEQGVDVRAETWPNNIHVFQILVGYVPESRAALRQVAEFITPFLPQSPNDS